MNFKDTLNILKTEFEMKGNLNKKEPEIQNFWINENIYQKLLIKNKNNKQWILHDGPPYANGNIHVGHSLNKIIKDIIIRHQTMNGLYCPYIPGWDTHGLPIEHALIKKNINKDPNLSINQKRDNCKNFAIENVTKQTKQFKRLGLISDFSDIYLTLDPEFESRQLQLFLSIVKKGLIYQDLKPIYWSWSSHTALAEAEIEYADHKAPSIYVSFDVVEGNEFISKNDKLIIWTTTPWTIPSNLAVAVNPNFKYLKIFINNSYFIVSSERLNFIVNELKWTNYKIVSEFIGKSMEKITYKHPLYNKNNPVILADYVSSENGTGLVHNAPGFGEEDYLACKKYNIPVFCPINEFGKFTKEINDSDLENVFYENANEIIIQKLLSSKNLLKSDSIIHSVAIDWRTKKPVIYRATKQWFVNINPIKKEIISALKNVVFSNEKDRDHLSQMIQNRSEWCISRQRVWGVPIPIIFDENKIPIFDSELILNIINILSKEGSNVWYEKSVKYFLTEKYLKTNKNFYKEKDIMDVWFDSGSSFTLLKSKNLNYPADLYFEGNDQYRGWFNSSLINSVILEGISPYKQLISHGFVLDEHGRKMSKSLGNVIDPLIICEQYGADILRLWVANSNYQEDVRISENILKQIAETYRRIRNTLFKFILSNVSDFDCEKNKSENFDDADKYVLVKLKENINKINKCFQKFDFSLIIRIINLDIIELSSWYFDVIKDTLYCDQLNDSRRRAIQTVLFKILYSYLILLSPIIPHTCEEVYSFLNFTNKQKSIFFESWNSVSVPQMDIDKNKWDLFFQIKKEVYSKLEKAREEKIITKNNQAKVVVFYKTRMPFEVSLMKKYLNVAIFEYQESKENDIKIIIENPNLIKCERCWNYFPSSQIQNSSICKRCGDIIKKCQ